MQPPPEVRAVAANDHSVDGIMLTSGCVSDELADSARSLGIQHVIYKANTVKELCDTVHRVLDARRA